MSASGAARLGFRFVVDRDIEVDVRAFDAGDRYRQAVGVIALGLQIYQGR